MGKSLRIFLLCSFVGTLYAGPKYISGVFDAGWTTFYLDSSTLDGMYADLQEMGINTIILQYGLSDPYHRYYPSQLSWAQSITDHSQLFPNSLKLAKKYGMNVYLGLYYEYTATWWGTPDNTFLEKAKNRCIEVFDELEEMYSSHTNIKGYYIPHEIARFYWQNSSDLQRLITVFMKPVTDHIHENSDKKVYISPFYNQELETPEELKQFYQNMFADWKPDIVGPQDGIGVDHVSFDSLGFYLKATKDAVEGNGLEFWVNVELFEGDGGPAAPFTRVRQQIDSAAAYASKLVSYDISVLLDDPLKSDITDYYITNFPTATQQNTKKYSQHYKDGKYSLSTNAPMNANTVQLYDLHGRQCFTGIDLTASNRYNSLLGKGMYIARVQSGSNSNECFTIIKTK